MTRKRMLTSVLLVAVVGISLIVNTLSASAFNQHRLIEDPVFDNYNSMTAAQIDAFLNARNSCIGTNSGFSAIDPIGYSPSGGYQFGGNVSAGTVIAHAAQAYDLNPQVLLVTLQKEQSLVTSTNCTTNTIAKAMGYACPDSGGSYSYSGVNLYTRNGVTYTSVSGICVNSAAKAGFSQQIIRAAWLFKFAQQRSLGRTDWAIVRGGWDNSDDLQSCYSGPMTQGYFRRCPSGAYANYDGYTTIDGSATHMDTGATAALYWYTPHFHGNQNFVSLFNAWFVPYLANYAGQSDYPTLDPGGQQMMTILYRNNGSDPWYDDASVPAGVKPVHLATSNPVNRISSFAHLWAGGARPSVQFTSVYKADGTTLASNQHIVQPGEIGKFTFWVKAPADASPGKYREHFRIILEGTVDGTFYDEGVFIDITVRQKPSLSLFSQSLTSTTIAASETGIATLRMKNNGNVPLYDDASLTSAPPGTKPVHLATSNPVNRSSTFGSTWVGPARPALQFTSVHNSDGTTRSSNQHVVNPGQIVTFTFPIKAPAGQAAGDYSEYFTPILEGTSGTLPDNGIHFDFTVPSQAAITYTQPPQTTTIASNQPTGVPFTIKNTGNATLTSGTQIVINSGSQFRHSSWESSTVAMTLDQSIAPNETVNLALPILAPTQSMSNTQDILISLRNSGSILPRSGSVAKINVVEPDFRAAYAGQSNWPSLSANQDSRIYFKYKNRGNQPWFDDSSVGSATWRALGPVHLAAASPLNRSSLFSASDWPSANRPSVQFSAVYESDGITPAANQHVVLPNQVALFDFKIEPHDGLSAGTYYEHFEPIVEGTWGMFNKVGTFQKVTFHKPTLSASYLAQTAHQLTISKGESAQISFVYQNNGTTPWFDDVSLSSAKTSTYPVHLATASPLNRSSTFGSTWPGAARPAVQFSSVYNSDLTTLTNNQHVVQPGQYGKFTFTVSVPGDKAPGTYRERIRIIAEGTPDGLFSDQGAYFDVIVP